MTKPADPIKEANVYLAYGRDAQAVEILKSALADDPSREDVKAKLAEIARLQQQSTAGITASQQVVVGVLLAVGAALKFVAADPALQMAGGFIGLCAVLYLCVCLVRKPGA